MFEFIRLQMKLRWGRDRGADKKNAVLTGFIGAVVILVLLALIYVFTLVLCGNVPEATAERCAAFFSTAIEACLTFAGVAMMLKWLYRPADLKIAARFPITPFRMYVANVILAFIHLFLYSAAVYLPVMTVCALAAGALSWPAFGGIVLGALLSPFVPFVLSMLISVPVLFCMAFLENRNIVKLILFIAVLAGGFVLYNYLLTVLADYFLNKNMSAETTGVWSEILTALDTPWNLSSWLGGLVSLRSPWQAVGLHFAVLIAGAAAGVALAKPVYDSVRRRMLESESGAFRRRTRCTDRGVFSAMFAHEFKEILRTRTYAYFYLGIAVATPVMVFFCNRLAFETGTAQIGQGINFGASVLVISVFMAMISSFAAASVTREGHRFFLTKIIPVSPRRQLAIKGTLNWLVSAGALAISLAVILSLDFVTPAQAAVIGLPELLLAGGFVLNGLNRNLKRPNIRLRPDGEINEFNITVMMLTGILLSAAAGLAALVLPFFMADGAVYAVLLALSAVYAASHLAIFLCTAKRRYELIEE